MSLTPEHRSPGRSRSFLSGRWGWLRGRAALAPRRARLDAPRCPIVWLASGAAPPPGVSNAGRRGVLVLSAVRMASSAAAARGCGLPAASAPVRSGARFRSSVPSTGRRHRRTACYSFWARRCSASVFSSFSSRLVAAFPAPVLNRVDAHPRLCSRCAHPGCGRGLWSLCRLHFLVLVLHDRQCPNPVARPSSRHHRSGRNWHALLGCAPVAAPVAPPASPNGRDDSAAKNQEARGNCMQPDVAADRCIWSPKRQNPLEPKL
jgi:hypothetical protein